MNDSTPLPITSSNAARPAGSADGRSPAASAASTPPHVASPPSAALTGTLARLLAAASDTVAQATAQAFSAVHVPLRTPTNPTSVVSREAAAVRLVSALCSELAEFHRRVDRLLQEHAATTGSAPIVLSPPEVLVPPQLHASSAPSSDASPASSALSSPAFDVAAWSRQAAAAAAAQTTAASVDSTVPASASAPVVPRVQLSSHGPQPPAVAALLAASVASPEPINVVLTQMQPESSPPLSLGMMHVPLPGRFASLSPLPPPAAGAANAQRSGVAAVASASSPEAAHETSTPVAPPATASAVPMDEVSLAALVQFDLATRATLRVSHPRLSFAAASARILEAFKALSPEEKQRYADKQKTMQQEQRQAEEKKQQAAVQARPKRKAAQQPSPAPAAAVSAAVVASAVQPSNDPVPAAVTLFAPSPMLSYHPRRGSTDGSFYALNAPGSFGSSLTASPLIPPTAMMQAQMAQQAMLQSPAPAQAQAMMNATPFSAVPAHRFPQAVPSRLGSVEFANAVAAYPGRRGSIAAAVHPRSQFSLPPAVPLASPFPAYPPPLLHSNSQTQLPPQNMLLSSPMLSSGALARLRSTSDLAFGHTPQHSRMLQVQTHSGSSQQLQASDFPVISDKGPSSSPASSPRSVTGTNSLVAGVPSPASSPRGNQGSELMPHQHHPHNSLRRDSTFSFAPGSPPAVSLSSISAANNALQPHHLHQLSSNSISSGYYQPASMSRNVSGVNLSQRVEDALMVGVGVGDASDHMRAMMNGSPPPTDSPRHLDRDDLHSRSNSLLFSRRRSTSSGMASPPPHDRDDPRGSAHEAIRIQPFVEEGEEEQQEENEREERGRGALQEGQTDNEEDAAADRSPTDDELDQADPAPQPPPMLLPSPIKRKLQAHAPPSAALVRNTIEQTPAKKQRSGSSNRS